MGGPRGLELKYLTEPLGLKTLVVGDIGRACCQYCLVILNALIIDCIKQLVLAVPGSTVKRHFSIALS